MGRTIAGKAGSVFEETGPKHSSSLLVQGFLYAKHVREMMQLLDLRGYVPQDNSQNQYRAMSSNENS